MIIALAGHVDHGKTSLIRALTGVETDRLQQEVERGLTIDLGFAYWRQGDAQLGFVDVPGHHRFIHNMLAGVSTHQSALLVIAADDGVMPQTREHLAIMQLLGLNDGIVAINKVDRVDADRLSQIQVQVAETLAGTFLSQAPTFAVSATSGQGIEDLRSALLQQSAGAHAKASTSVNARLPIDRAFSYKGVGTIVTGTLHSGSLSVEQGLQLFPSGKQTRVRSLRVNDVPAQTATMGNRVAVNLAGVEPAEVKRGMWLQQGNATGSQSIAVELQVLADFPRAIKHWSSVHLYHGATHVIAHLALLEPQASAQPGQSVLAELVCPEPLLAMRDDRLILRDHGLDQTIGGARVISNQPSNNRRRDPQRLVALSQQARCTNLETSFTAALASGSLEMRAFADNWNLTAAATEGLLQRDDVTLIDQTLVTNETLQRLIKQTLDRFAALSSSSEGIAADAFCDAPTPAIQAHILKHLLSSGQMRLQAGLYIAASAAGQLSSTEAALLERLRPNLSAEQPPSLGDIGKQLSIPADALRKAVVPLAGKGHLVLFGSNRLMLPERFKELAELAQTLQAREGAFTVKQFRDASGLGRNLVIDVLEHMDAGGFTKRFDNTRKVVGNLDRLLSN